MEEDEIRDRAKQETIIAYKRVLEFLAIENTTFTDVYISQMHDVAKELHLIINKF